MRKGKVIGFVCLSVDLFVTTEIAKFLDSSITASCNLQQMVTNWLFFVNKTFSAEDSLQALQYIKEESMLRSLSFQWIS